MRTLTKDVILIGAVMTALAASAGAVIPLPADYNGDGRADLAVLDRLSRVHIAFSGRNEYTRTGFRAQASDAVPVRGDFDGDGIADVAYFEPGTGSWRIRGSETGELLFGGPIQWGYRGTIPVPGDYSGDGRTDIAVYEPSTGDWYIRRSSDGKLMGGGPINWGYARTKPVPGDYTGDGVTEIAVYEQHTGDWYIRKADGTLLDGKPVNWGWTGADPIPADYEGDGITNIAVYQPHDAVWIIRLADGTIRRRQYGWSAATPVPADYDGDGKTDLAVFDPLQREWYIDRSKEGFIKQRFGWSTRGDFNGDGRADLAVFCPHSASVGVQGQWYFRHGPGQFSMRQYGYNGVVPLIADFDGDGISDIAVYEPERSSSQYGLWTFTPSSSPDGKPVTVQFGSQRAIPVPSDFNGDGRDDFAVYYPQDEGSSRAGEWYIRHQRGGPDLKLTLGGAGAIPLTGDFNGDGRSDIAVYYPKDPDGVMADGTWIIRYARDGRTETRQFGWSEARPVPADFDGDLVTDLAVIGMNNILYIQLSSAGKIVQLPLLSGFTYPYILPLDYDGDGRADVVVQNTFAGDWAMGYSSRKAEKVQFGWHEAFPVGGVQRPQPETLPIKTEGEGFLWKPVSESDGRLLVMVPRRMTPDLVRKVVIARDPAGHDVIDPGEGRDHGEYGDGRWKRRFPRPGSYYGGPCYVVVHFHQGPPQPYAIRDGAVRQE